MIQNRYVCPECGKELVKDYINGKGEQTWYCPDGDEHYVFRPKGDYMYAVRVYDGAKFCVGTTQAWHDSCK